MQIRYSRYEETFDDLDTSEVMSWLKDFLLDSGFRDPYSRPGPGRGKNRQGLYQALFKALLEHHRVPPDWPKQTPGTQNPEEGQPMQALRQLAQRLASEGYLHLKEPWNSPGGTGGIEKAGQAHFELTQRSIDLLGFQSLRALLGGLGQGTAGLHLTSRKAPGAERTGETKNYQFGDQLNLNAAETLKRTLPKSPARISDDDLVVELAEDGDSMSTVLLLDCSHSMILYGEDRFTPAKQVALALAHLIRTQYPGDELHFGVFHDGAEELPLVKLAQVQVGSHHTNTAEGLKLARRILKKSGTRMKQIIMITDGKPSALMLPSGQIYKNAWGLDPLIMAGTLEQVTAARREGVPIHTFMLANEPALVTFVREIGRITRGKVYFTTPSNIGRYVLVDFLNMNIRRAG